MSDQFIGEIRMFGSNFAPLGWHLCDGSLLPISQNTALFSLLGTFYGGDGVSTFALPDLRARVPIGAGQGPGLSNRNVGDSGGEAGVTLTTAQMPAHAHALTGTAAAATGGAPSGALPAQTSGHIYGAPTHPVALNPAAIGPQGGNLPHNNLQPYLVVSYIIALQGIFPSRA